jgi:hypothetical protein
MGRIEGGRRRGRRGDGRDAGRRRGHGVGRLEVGEEGDGRAPSVSGREGERGALVGRRGETWPRVGRRWSGPAGLGWGFFSFSFFFKSISNQFQTNFKPF